MVLAYHVVFSTYGFWLPNDPRGSGSDFVRNRDLYTYGCATKVTTRRSVSRKPHDYALRQIAKASLRYPAVRFTGKQALCVGNGFKGELNGYGGTIHACAIMSDIPPSAGPNSIPK